MEVLALAPARQMHEAEVLQASLPQRERLSHDGQALFLGENRAHSPL